MERAIEIENNVMELMKGEVSKEGECQRCCTMMKKMKDIINKLRSSLREESDQI